MRGRHEKKQGNRSDAAADEFDDDVLGGAFAERDPGSTELAEQSALTGDLLDHGGFAKPHLPQALAKIFFPSELAHTTDSTDRKLGQTHT
jgi:hypothetical protein